MTADPVRTDQLSEYQLGDVQLGDVQLGRNPLSPDRRSEVPARAVEAGAVEAGAVEAGESQEGDAQAVVESLMARAIDEYGTNHVSRRLLRRLSLEFPEEFSAAALGHLEGSSGAGVYRLLAILLFRQPGLFELFSNPAAASRERAVRLAKRLLEFDPAFDVRLAHLLPDRNGTNWQQACTGSRASRLLGILDEISPGRNLLPVVSHLVYDPDPRLAADAALFVGRRLMSVEWVTQQLQQTDQRVRANALEAIWGLRTPAAMALLEACARDANNRVAGNALIGLNAVDAPGVREAIVAMAADPGPRFRSTAAWVMGEVGDPQFVPQLEALLRDEDRAVRSTALRTLIRLRRNETPAERGQAELRPEAAIATVPTPAPPIPQPPPPQPPPPQPAPVQKEEAAEPVPAPILPELRLDGSSFKSRMR